MDLCCEGHLDLYLSVCLSVYLSYIAYILKRALCVMFLVKVVDVNLA